MFLRQLSIEIRKTLKQPALWLGLAGLLLLLALFIFVHHSQIRFGFIPSEGGPEQDLLAGLSFFNWIGGFIYAVTGSVITAYDYADLRIWLTRGLPRSTPLLARLVVILLTSGLIVSFSVFATLGLAALSRLLFFGEVNSSQLSIAAIPTLLLRLFWSSLPYLALTFLLAIFSRSMVFAAGAMILYTDVLEKMLLAVSDRYPLLTRFLPGRLSLILQINNYLLDRGGSRPFPDTPMIIESQAIFAIASIFTILCGISFIIFSRQDLGG